MGFLVGLGYISDSLQIDGFCWIFVVVGVFEREEILLCEDKPSPWNYSNDTCAMILVFWTVFKENEGDLFHSFIKQTSFIS